MATKEQISDVMAEMGRRRANALTAERRSEIARKAANARWSKAKGTVAAKKSRKSAA